MSRAGQDAVGTSVLASPRCVRPYDRGMIEDEGRVAETDPVDDVGDGDEDDALRWWSFSSMADPRGQSVAALVLAAISLIGIEAARDIANAAALNDNSFLHSQAIVDGIQAGVAAVAVILGLYVVREEWDAEEASLGRAGWHAPPSWWAHWRSSSTSSP